MTFQPGPTMDKLPPEASAASSAPETAPKRRGRPPGSRNSGAPRGRPRKSLKDQIGATLITFNLALWAVPPTRNDALDDKEIELLAEAIDNQAKISPTFRRYLEVALAATTGGQLISVVGIIAARRFARHEFLLPKEADDMLGKMIGSVKIIPTEEPSQESPNGSAEWVDVHASAAA